MVKKNNEAMKDNSETLNQMSIENEELQLSIKGKDSKITTIE